MGRSLARLYASRRRAASSLGLSLPREPSSEVPEPLALRIARLDRWIACELDLAGGKHFPPWEELGEEPAAPGPRFRSG